MLRRQHTQAYTWNMIKHTTLNLDMELLARAQQELGTRTATDTIHRALEEAVNRARRRRLLDHDFSELTPEVIDEMRRPRFAEPPTEKT